MTVRVDAETKAAVEAEARRYSAQPSDILRAALDRRAYHVDGQTIACAALVDALRDLREAGSIDRAIAAIERGLTVLS